MHTSERLKASADMLLSAPDEAQSTGRPRRFWAVSDHVMGRRTGSQGPDDARSVKIGVEAGSQGPDDARRDN